MKLSAARAGILMTMHRMSQGGADRVAVLLANGFVAAGIPTELALLRDGGEGEHTLRALLNPAVSVRSAGSPMGSRHLELARGLKYIHHEIATSAPALVLASSSNMGLVTGLAARSYGDKAPQFAMKLTNPVFRPSDSSLLRTTYRRNLYGFIFGNYDLVMMLTDAERLDMSRIYGPLARKFRTVPNAYISDEISAEQPAPRLPGPPRILTAARMMPQKRLDVLLDAFARLKVPDVRLTILGDGPKRSSLEQQACSLGIADRVEMSGFVDDVLPWLRQTDLFVLSSDYEGLPAAILEALTFNVPVVTTNCFAGASEMLSHLPYCAVTPVGDAGALASAIATSLASRQPTSQLRETAQGYTVKASIAAHIAALKPFMEGSW